MGKRKIVDKANPGLLLSSIFFPFSLSLFLVLFWKGEDWKKSCLLFSYCLEERREREKVTWCNEGERGERQ